MGILDSFLIAFGVLLGLAIGYAIRNLRLMCLRTTDNGRRHFPPNGNGGLYGDMTGVPVRPKRSPPSLRAAAEAIPEPEPVELVLRGHAPGIGKPHSPCLNKAARLALRVAAIHESAAGKLPGFEAKIHGPKQGSSLHSRCPVSVT
jgi:hypothetical protein